MPDPAAYDMPRALAYIESLQRFPDRLAAEDFLDEAARIQPTIGVIAAGLVDLLVRSGRTARIFDFGTSLGYSACASGTEVLLRCLET